MWKKAEVFLKARSTCTCQVSTNSKNYLIVTKHNWHIWFSVLKTRGLGKSWGIYITFIKGILFGRNDQSESTYLQKTLKNNITLSLVLAFCKKNGTLIRVIDTLPWLMMWEKFQNWVLLVEKGKTFLTWITKKCNVKCGMS